MYYQFKQLQECFNAIRRQFPDQIESAGLKGPDHMVLNFEKGKRQNIKEIKKWILDNYEGSEVKYTPLKNLDVKIKLTPTIFIVEGDTTIIKRKDE